MMLRESYFRYAVRDDDEAFSREKMAKEVYNFYQSSNKNDVRIDLPKLPMLRYFSLLDFLNDPRYPLSLRLALRGRIKVERPALAEQLERQEKESLKKEE